MAKTSKVFLIIFPDGSEYRQATINMREGIYYARLQHADEKHIEMSDPQNDPRVATYLFDVTINNKKTGEIYAIK